MIHVGEYKDLDGRLKTLVARVDDGSIITRFDKTPVPTSTDDIVCPHFLELKWALGCPFSCAWCYLQGTMRMYARKKKPTYRLSVRDDNRFADIERTLRELFRLPYPDEPELLNAGELSDALMSERGPFPFSRFAVPLFETQERYRLLLLSKSPWIENLVDMGPHNQTVVSFSLNADPVAKRWEKAPPIWRRIEAAARLAQVGYEVRVRIDPIVPYPSADWLVGYFRLLDDIFTRFRPSRITLGSLRGLQSTINAAKDRTWVDYLSEPSPWGRRVAEEMRLDAFGHIIERLQSGYGYSQVALCKETMGVWQSLGMDWRHCQCNCTP
jgi:spore photoproduct lyase